MDGVEKLRKYMTIYASNFHFPSIIRAIQTTHTLFYLGQISHQSQRSNIPIQFADKLLAPTEYFHDSVC